MSIRALGQALMKAGVQPSTKFLQHEEEVRAKKEAARKERLAAKAKENKS